MDPAPQEQRVLDKLRGCNPAMLEDLRALVAIPTGFGHEPGLEETRSILIGRLTKLGATPHRVSGATPPPWLREGSGKPSDRPPPFIVCRKHHPNARARVLLCGHVDTVHDPEGQFQKLKIEGERASGPGCADMKGGLLVAIAALEAIEAAGVPLSWSFAIVSDEETGSFCSGQALQEEAAQGYTAGLVFEPALPDGGLVIERPGSGQFMIECHGRAAHVGRDFSSGISAVHALTHAIQRCLHMADLSRGLIVNIGPLEGGSATNIVPDRARAWGNIRCMSDCALQTVTEGLRSLEMNSHTLPSTKTTFVMNRPAKPTTHAVAELAEIAKACAESLGQKLPFGKTGGVCDGNNMQAAGLPTLDTLGVRGGGLHTTDEWIDLKSLEERAMLTALILTRLAHRGA